jgi:hypothetical protein
VAATRRLPLYLLLAVCIAPVVASYLTYYVFPPEGRTNYGDLLQPQKPVPALALRGLDGVPADLRQLRGKWLMLKIASARCEEPCRTDLWRMRQLRTASGKNRDRIERVVLLVDDATPDAALLQEHEGARFLRASRADLAAFMAAADGRALEDHIWLVDPLGNLMMRWPAPPEADRIKKDLNRLLAASRVG